MTRAYYNEIDPFAAQWLRNLIREGLIADGDVDERDVWDVRPSDVAGYTQCHFFAGIGGWSVALRLAGVPDSMPVWTGSCPCQPFSAAGAQLGFADERHLWPAWHWLIGECRPPVVFGEQVASRLGRDWLAVVRADMEGLAYEVGAADLCAAGVGAPHIRQRIWFVANAEHGGRSRRHAAWEGAGADVPSVVVGSMANAEGVRHSQRELRHSNKKAEPTKGNHAKRRQKVVGLLGPAWDCANSGMANCVGTGLEVVGVEPARSERPAAERGCEVGAWRDIEWLACRDGKARPTQPGLQPLANGIPGRVGRLRAYGNAIVPQVAAEFIAAALDL